MAKKFNTSLFISCIVGGMIGFIFAEILYNHCKNTWNPIILVGIYFAIVAFFISLLGSISEYNTNHISRGLWDTTAVTRTMGLVILISILGFFIAGGLFQFIYGLGKVYQVSKNTNDYIVMIDNSGSTSNTDYNEERFSSVVDFIKGMKKSQRIMISIFDEKNKVILPLTRKDGKLADKVQKILSKYSSANNTNIQNALSDSLDHYKSGGKRAIAILFSDGESPVNIPFIEKSYNDAKIPIFTVGYKGHNGQGQRLMEKLAYRTGGDYYEIHGEGGFSKAYNKVVHYKAKRVLLDYRIASEHSRVCYIVLRVLFIMILVFLLGPGLSLILDSEDVLRDNLIFRIFIGLMSGLILEYGLMNYLPGMLMRFIVCFLMSLVISKYEPITYEGINIPGISLNPYNNPTFSSPLDDKKREIFNNSKGSYTSKNTNSSKEFLPGSQSIHKHNNTKPPKFM